MLIDYIVPVRKAVSVAAIYNDMCFLPSIWELTVEDGESFESAFVFGGSPTYENKPGTKISSRTTTVNNGAISDSYVYEEKRGWTSYRDREESVFESLGTMTWDNWDKELLRNSKNRLKTTFRKAYNDRDFDMSGGTNDGNDAAAQFKTSTKQKLMPNLASRKLPWWKKGLIRSNPFDKNGNECKREPND